MLENEPSPTSSGKFFHPVPLIHSFIHSFIRGVSRSGHSFIHSLREFLDEDIHSFIHSFIRVVFGEDIHSFVHPSAEFLGKAQLVVIFLGTGRRS